MNLDRSAKNRSCQLLYSMLRVLDLIQIIVIVMMIMKMIK